MSRGNNDNSHNLVLIKILQPMQDGSDSANPGVCQGVARIRKGTEMIIRYTVPKDLRWQSQKMIAQTQLADRHPNSVMPMRAVKHRDDSADVDTESADAGPLLIYIPNFKVKDRVDAAKSIARQVFAGLLHFDVVHGMQHRNISPKTIFLCRDGCVKLGFFDLLEESLIKENPDWYLNNPYVAPEHRGNPTKERITERLKSDQKADVWAVGATIVAILLGKTLLPKVAKKKPREVQAPTPTQGQRNTFDLEKGLFQIIQENIEKPNYLRDVLNALQTEKEEYVRDKKQSFADSVENFINSLESAPELALLLHRCLQSDPKKRISLAEANALIYVLGTKKVEKEAEKAQATQEIGKAQAAQASVNESPRSFAPQTTPDPWGTPECKCNGETPPKCNGETPPKEIFFADSAMKDYLHDNNWELTETGQARLTRNNIEQGKKDEVKPIYDECKRQSDTIEELRKTKPNDHSSPVEISVMEAKLTAYLKEKWEILRRNDGLTKRSGQTSVRTIARLFVDERKAHKNVRGTQEKKRKADVDKAHRDKIREREKYALDSLKKAITPVRQEAAKVVAEANEKQIPLEAIIAAHFENNGAAPAADNGAAAPAAARSSASPVAVLQAVQGAAAAANASTVRRMHGKQGSLFNRSPSSSFHPFLPPELQRNSSLSLSLPFNIFSPYSPPADKRSDKDNAQHTKTSSGSPDKESSFRG